MKTKILITLFLSSSFFISCNQCYECEKYEHCFTCTVNATGIPPFDVTDCYDSPSERDTEMASFQSGQTQQGNTTTCTKAENLIPGFQQEICDKKDEAKDAAEDLEVTGFICTEE